MNWTPEELFYELSEDPERRILFVEGVRDLAFWREVFPSTDRFDAAVYPISVVICAPVKGGERGRLLWCAEVFCRNACKDRALFFADADCDIVLGLNCAPNVVFTDGRDLESYGLTTECLARLATTGLRLDESEGVRAFLWVVEITRPIGILRIASERRRMELPFQRTFRKGLSRFLVGEQYSATLDMRRLISTLLQNAERSLSDVDEVMSFVDEEAGLQSSVETRKLSHGKDLVRSLACLYKIEESHVESMLFLSMDYSEIRRFPNIQTVISWISKAR